MHLLLELLLLSLNKTLTWLVIVSPVTTSNASVKLGDKNTADLHLETDTDDCIGATDVNVEPAE